MRKMIFILVIMFLIGGLTIFGLNRLSGIIYSNNISPSNNSNKFIDESKPEGSVDDSELEKQNENGQIYYENIDDAYKLLGINEVEAIKEKSSLYIKNVLKFTDVKVCKIKSFNLEGQKIIFNMVVNKENFTVMKNKETDEVIVQIETDADGGD